MHPIRWLIIATVVLWLVHLGLVGARPLPDPGGWFTNASTGACEPVPEPGPVTVVSVGHTVGAKAKAVTEATPDQVVGAVSETFKMLGIAAGSFKRGVQGEPIPPAASQWEAEAVAARTPKPCQPPQEPTIVAAGGSSDGPPVKGWGGHVNGRIPASAMCAPKTAPRALFHCDAAAAFDQMSAAFKGRFGRNISVTDSYRDYAGQVACRRAKGSMCAVPGTSNHGWGLAADLGAGIQAYGLAQHKWMAANARTYGWVLPSWAQQGGSKEEPWHWEFKPTEAAG